MYKFYVENGDYQVEVFPNGKGHLVSREIGTQVDHDLDSVVAPKTFASISTATVSGSFLISCLINQLCQNCIAGSFFCFEAISENGFLSALTDHGLQHTHTWTQSPCAFHPTNNGKI